MMRISLCLLIFLLAISGFSAERSDVLEGPPEEQPGNDETFEITVGQARKALYYKQVYPIMLDWIEDLEENNEFLLEENNSLLDKIEKQKTLTTVLAVGMSAVSLTFAILYVLK
jgi:hypothetical protein